MPSFSSVLLPTLLTATLAWPLGPSSAPVEASAVSGGVSDTLRVLFVGNSYTYYHNVPELVEAFSAALPGPPVRASAHTHGGITLRGHLADGHLPGLLDADEERDGGARGPDAAGGRRWDRVVLQEQSLLGTGIVDPTTGELGEPHGFRASVRALAEMVRSGGAEPVLYMTWARERFPGQLSDLAAAYVRAGSETGSEVAPVGVAWGRVRAERPEISLFDPDGSHPAPGGSYLAACVLYATLTGKSPVGAPAVVRGGTWDGPGLRGKLLHLLPFRPEIPLVSLEPELARYLQEVAWAVVRAERAGAATP